MQPRPVAASVDALVAGASSRVPMTAVDSKSGARFERVVLDDEPYVLKHVDHRDDWIMRQTGDLGCVPLRVWESGVFDLLPPCIDHATVGAAREGDRGAVLMRDVGEWLVPADDTPIPPDQHLQLLDHLAALHAAAWGWRDTVGLVPVANRYSFFGPAAMACEAALRLPATGTRHRGRRLAPARRRVARSWPTRCARCATRRGRCSTPWPRPRARSSTATRSSRTPASGPDGRTVLVDWSMTGAGPPVAEVVHSLALNRARIPDGLRTRRDAIDAYRAALERHGVDTAPWFERQLALCLVGVMLQLAWEKAFDETGDELAWWRDRTVDTARELVRS